MITEDDVRRIALALVRMDADDAARLGELPADACDVRAPVGVRGARGAGPS